MHSGVEGNKFSDILAKIPAKNEHDRAEQDYPREASSENGHRKENPRSQEDFRRTSSEASDTDYPREGASTTS